MYVELDYENQLNLLKRSCFIFYMSCLYSHYNYKHDLLKLHNWLCTVNKVIL